MKTLLVRNRRNIFLEAEGRDFASSISSVMRFLTKVQFFFHAQLVVEFCRKRVKTLACIVFLDYDNFPVVDYYCEQLLGKSGTSTWWIMKLRFKRNAETRSYTLFSNENIFNAGRR